MEYQTKCKCLNHRMTDLYLNCLLSVTGDGLSLENTENHDILGNTGTSISTEESHRATEHEDIAIIKLTVLPKTTISTKM